MWQSGGVTVNKNIGRLNAGVAMHELKSGGWRNGGCLCVIDVTPLPNM